MNDVEKKLKETKLPDIRLEAHRKMFFKHLAAKQTPASFRFSFMVRIREAVMVFLIVALTLVNIFWGGLPKSEKAFAVELKEVQDKIAEVSETVNALRPDHLVIVPLYNGLANRTGRSGALNDWILFPEYEGNVALFAVLPAGVPPYTWTVSDPAILALTLTSEGFIAKARPLRAGRTVLQVKDASGLTGELVITVEAMTGTPETKEVILPPSQNQTPDDGAEKLKQLQEQLKQLQQQLQ